MSWKSTAAFLALTFFGVGSLVYLLLHKDDENLDFPFVKSSKTTVSEIKIPKDTVGIVIGRGGLTINEIKKKADVEIKIIDDPSSDDFKICTVRGIPEAVQYAESLIHEIIVSQSLIESFEMYVPLHACGRLIGKNGDNIRLICRNSNAKVVVAAHIPSNPDSLERKVIIKGTSEQIALAKALVEQKLEEEKEFRNKLENLVSNRAPRNKPKYLLPASNESEELNASTYKEKFIATGSNGLLEVYVSAIESPNRFWVQMMGPCTVELDRLNEQMTDYYSKTESKILHKLREVKSGQIVAAPFTFDKKWYRAEVVDFQSSSEGEDVQLYYVDYGNMSQCKKDCIYELRTDFLRLRFQAIECILAKVNPRDSTWSEEAIEAFEDLTHAALWKSLVAKIDTYKDRPTRAKREGSPIPCVELYDTQGEKTINVAEELVGRGFAVWEAGAQASKHESFEEKPKVL